MIYSFAIFLILLARSTGLNELLRWHSTMATSCDHFELNPLTSLGFSLNLGLSDTKLETLNAVLTREVATNLGFRESREKYRLRCNTSRLL